MLLSGIEAMGFFCTVNSLMNLSGFITFALYEFKEAIVEFRLRLGCALNDHDST